MLILVASVRTAKHLKTGKEFAVKVVNKHETGHTRSRLFREVQIFKMCQNHANIVQLIEVMIKLRIINHYLGLIF